MNRDAIEKAIDVLCGHSSKLRAKRDCELCGDPKAVGKYFVKPEGDNHPGWWRVCSYCAAMVSNVGADVQYYKNSTIYKEMTQKDKLQTFAGCCHEWSKWSLVGEVDRKRELVFDWMRCNKCHCFGKRFYLGQTVMEDLTSEIDLSCSR